MKKFEWKSIGFRPGDLLPFGFPALTFASGGAAGRRQKLEIAFSLDIPPYVMDQAAAGIEIETVRGALEQTGYTFETRQFSYHDLADAVQKHDLDAAATVIEKDDGTFYSANYVRFENYAFTKKAAGIDIERISDLKGKSIVAWENAYEDLGPEFEELFSPQANGSSHGSYREIADQAEQVAMFYRGEADVIVIDKAIMLWLAKQLSDKMDTSAELSDHDIFADKTEFRISFRSEQVRDDFNRGLRQIRENGVLQQIYSRYLGS